MPALTALPESKNSALPIAFLTPETVPGPFLVPLRGGFKITTAGGQVLSYDILIESYAKTRPIGDFNPAVLHNRVADTFLYHR